MTSSGTSNLTCSVLDGGVPDPMQWILILAGSCPLMFGFFALVCLILRQEKVFPRICLPKVWVKFGFWGRSPTKTLHFVNRRLDIFETPVTVTPTGNLKKTLNSSKLPSKYLTFTFGERTFTFGERMFTFWEITSTFADNPDFRGFGNFFFCCWGVLRLRGLGRPYGLSNISIYIYICCEVIIWSKFGGFWKLLSGPCWVFGSYYLVQVCVFSL